MSVGKRTIEYLAEKINIADDEKQAIIYMVEANDLIEKKLKNKEKNAWKESLKQEVPKIEFDPTEIEPIILKKKDRDERE